MAKRLMFWSSIAFAQKVPKLNWCELAPRRLVGAVENKHMVVALRDKKSIGRRLRCNKSLVLCLSCWHHHSLKAQSNGRMFVPHALDLGTLNRNVNLLHIPAKASFAHRPASGVRGQWGNPSAPLRKSTGLVATITRPRRSGPSRAEPSRRRSRPRSFPHRAQPGAAAFCVDGERTE
jgi:hypothetical protein